jgi:heat shock protein HslJ/uncharacterized membrane protein/membrane-bound inhibitor of C-type lysozyme
VAAGCAGRTAGEPAPAAPSAAAYVFSCADGTRFAASFRDDSATVEMGAREVTLPRVASASGARYEASGTMLFTRADEAILQLGREEHRDCRGTPVEGPWERARALGVDFRAVGQEPGWVVEIEPRRQILFLGDYGRTRVVTPAPEPNTAADGARIYEVRTEAHDLVVEIRETACSDVMSGEPFTHTVTVRVDGDTLRGCGRFVGEPPLVGPRWSLVELNGASVPADADIEIRFDAEGRVSGSTGCNSLGGPFQVQERALRFGDLATTRRACLDPARAAREQAFVSRLAAVDGYTVAPATLELHSGGRTILRFTSRPD